MIFLLFTHVNPHLLCKLGTSRADCSGAGCFHFSCTSLRKEGWLFQVCLAALSLHVLCLAELYGTAPELLRLPEVLWSGSPKGDIYSFAILMRELIHQQDCGPFDDLDEAPNGTTGAAPWQTLVIWASF